MTDNDKPVEVIQADRDWAEAIATALTKYGVAYSHTTLRDFSTADRQWLVHEAREGENPFDRSEWLGQFDSKAEATAFCAELRRNAAEQVAARHRLNTTVPDEVVKALETLRPLSDRATPGPWCWEQCGDKSDDPVVGIAFPGDDDKCERPYSGMFEDSDAYRETIALEWPACDGNSGSANADLTVAAVNFVRTALQTIKGNGQ